MVGFEELIEVLNQFQLLSKKLNHLIAEYSITIEWETKSITKKTTEYPYGLLVYQQILYLCNFESINYPSHHISSYHVNGDLRNEITKNDYLTLHKPCAIDIDIKTLLIYIVDFYNFQVFDLALTRVSSFSLPSYEGRPHCSEYRWLKIDHSILYLVIEYINLIYLCKNQYGNILQEFKVCDDPAGLTVDNKFIYLCDFLSHQIQILNKENGLLINQWGQKGKEQGYFIFPISIHNNIKDDIIYVGDFFSVQLFEKKMGECIERINGGDRNKFGIVNGIYVMNDKLFVSDSYNKRIQIFNRPKS